MKFISIPQSKHSEPLERRLLCILCDTRKNTQTIYNYTTISTMYIFILEMQVLPKECPSVWLLSGVTVDTDVTE